MKKLSEIEFLKGYSIFSIVLFHLLFIFGKNMPEVFFKAISFGGTGVHVFILCSGFGLGLSQLKNKAAYLDFLNKRFSKIYFPYITIIIISFLIPYMYSDNDRFMALLSHLFLFKMFSPHFMNSFGMQFWFISMIIQFYLLFPLLFSIFNKLKDGPVLVATIIVSLAWAAFITIIGKEDSRVWNSFFLQYLWEFVLGMILARRYFTLKSLTIPPRKVLALLSFVCLVLYAILGIKGGVFKLFNDIPALIGYLSLALLIYSMKIKFINEYFIYTSKISYEWYLTHILIFTSIYFFFIHKYPIYIIATFALIISYFLSIMYHYVFNMKTYRKKEKLN